MKNHVNQRHANTQVFKCEFLVRFCTTVFTKGSNFLSSCTQAYYRVLLYTTSSYFVLQSSTLYYRAGSDTIRSAHTQHMRFITKFQFTSGVDKRLLLAPCAVHIAMETLPFVENIL